MFLPRRYSCREVKEEVRARVIADAAAGGEFVSRIRIGDGARHSAEWVRWRTSYLPGPPGIRRLWPCAERDETAGEAGW